MPPCVRIGDTAGGHGSFPPTTAVGGSDSASGNVRGIHRTGDSDGAHGSPSPSPVHSRWAGDGSPNISCNNKSIMRLGDPIRCGGNFVTGSSNIFAN